MKPLAFILGFALMASLAQAQINYSHALDQARNAANSGSGNEGGGGGGGQAPSQPSAPPVNPVLAATLQNIANLSADIVALNDADGKPDDSLKLPLLNDLAAAAQGAKPSETTIKRLGTDFANAVAGHKSLHDQKTRLAQYLHALCNGSHLTDVQQQSLIDKVQKIMENNGISPDDTQNVVDDLKATATQTK